MPPFLRGTVAIVTGASRGLGAATAEALAEAGAAVVLVARGASDIQAHAARLRDCGKEALAVATDISDVVSVGRLLEETVKAYSRVDFLINIAGCVDGIGCPGWLLDPDDWQHLLATNVTGPYLLLRATVPIMLRQREGRLLFLTSPAGEFAVPSAAGYGASKAAVNQLVRVLALELAGSGVTINAFNPGPVATPTFTFVEGHLTAGRWRNLWRGMAQDPRRAADFVLWLVSEATRDVSGQVISWNQSGIAEMMFHFRRHLGIPMT